MRVPPVFRPHGALAPRISGHVVRAKISEWRSRADNSSGVLSRPVERASARRRGSRSPRGSRSRGGREVSRETHQVHEDVGDDLVREPVHGAEDLRRGLGEVREFGVEDEVPARLRARRVAARGARGATRASGDGAHAARQTAHANDLGDPPGPPRSTSRLSKCPAGRVSKRTHPSDCWSSREIRDGRTVSRIRTARSRTIFDNQSLQA